MTLQTAFATLLARYSGETDIVMERPSQIGHARARVVDRLFVNTLVLRSDCPAIFFRHAAATKQAHGAGGFEHQHIPFEMAGENCSGTQFQPQPAVQIVHAESGQDQSKLELPGLNFRFSMRTTHREVRSDAGLHDGPVASGPIGILHELFAAHTIAHMADAFAAAVGRTVAEPECRSSACR